MKKIYLLPCVIFILFSGCRLLDKKKTATIVYVRVVNTGTIPTKSYILNEPIPHKHKPIQHFFPGLQPGDTTGYLPFKRINKGGNVTVILDSMVISRNKLTDCKDCMLMTAKKVNVCIKVVSKEQTSKKGDLAVDVKYDSN